MQVVHFNRKPRKYSNYSMEGIFKNIRKELSSKINIEVVECPFESNGIIKRIYNCIYSALRQKDVNHITGDVNYLNLFFNKNKTILTIHDCGILDRLKGIKFFITKLFWYSIPISRSKFVVAISNSTKKEILKFVKCNPEKIIVIYDSISPVFKRFEKEFNTKKPVILQVGTSYNKNLTRVVTSLKGIECKLNIIGILSSSDIDELNRNRIDYENFYDLTDEEVYEQYKASDILIFVSTYEGFGMPIVEANTVGRPVITSNILSMPEVACNAAHIVDPYNIDEIRTGIMKIINDDKYRNDLVNKGYENAKRFYFSKIAEEYYGLYENVLGT